MRFDFCGDESGNEAVATKKGSYEMQIGDPNAVWSASQVDIASPGELMNQRRGALIRIYRKQPERAMIQDGARTVQTRYAPSDPLHSEVEIGLGYGVKTPVGVHRGLGGLHDFPNPGDILCSALAACADSTIRQIAGQLHVEIRTLEVSVAGDIDLRCACRRRSQWGFNT